MTPRERVLTAMRRQMPDRVPRFLDYASFAPGLMEIFRQRTGCSSPDEYFDYDVRIVRFSGGGGKREEILPYLPESIPEGAWIDWDWGNVYVKGAHGNVNQALHHGLSQAQSVEDIEKFPMAKYLEPRRWEYLAGEVTQLHESGYAALGYLSQTLFETAWKVRGFENFLMDMAAEPELVEALLERLTLLRIGQAAIYARADVDILRLGDDVGTERGMMISPAFFRKMLKPRYERIIRAARQVKPDLLVLFHSDGDCREIIPDLIDIGVDTLNPVQPECMDPAEIKRLYGDRLSFAGTVGTQTTMPFGTPEDVVAEVKLRIETVGKGGGLLLCPTHLLQDEVPFENVLALFEAVEKYGSYERR